MDGRDMIVKILNDFEIRCVTRNFKEYSFNIENNLEISHKLLESVSHVFQCIVKSDYESVLQMNLSDLGWFPAAVNDQENLEDFICDFVNDSNNNDISRLIKKMILFFIAISAQQEFVRCNFCGPMHNVEQYNVISVLLPDSHISDSEVCVKLSKEGEPVYPKVVYPKLLYLSDIFLTHVKISTSLTQQWWLLRCTFLKQSILPEVSMELHENLVSLIGEIEQMDWISKEENISNKLIFVIECCQIFVYYGAVATARKYLTNAQIITGLEIELSGSMGKRTRFQQKDVAQLFVKLNRSHSNFTGTVPNKNEFVPADLHLQDDTLLNKVSFVNEFEYNHQSLFAEEQMVLLGYCCLVQRSGSVEELLHEELMSYIDCLLSQPQIVWSGYLKALILRCKTEKRSSRRIERAVMQLEAILESVRSASTPLSERENLFYCTSFPAYWTLEKELADLLISIGCTKSALEIYERLELWEDIVKCYVLLGRTNCAEKVILQQLKKTENSMLWCLLGDVTDKTEHYLKAWEFSNYRSARAQRSLGNFYFKRKEYAVCLPHFKLSLEINHLQPNLWFSAGHAATQLEDFDFAARAYRQVVMFEDDNFQAWNNLANAYIKTNNKMRAWRALQEALKCNYEEWRVWENFLLVSTDIGAFEDALRAWHRLLDIKGKHCDSLLLEILVNAVIKDMPDVNGCPSSRLRKRALELLGRITSVTYKDATVWELYSSLTYSDFEESTRRETVEKALLYQHKAVRCYVNKDAWQQDFAEVKQVLLCSQKYADLYLSYVQLLEGDEKRQKQCYVELQLRSIVTGTEKHFHCFPCAQKEAAEDLLEALKNTLHSIITE